MEHVRSEELFEIASEIFRGLGSPEDEVERVTAHIIENSLIGYDSHGVRLVPDYARMVEAGHLLPGQNLECLSDKGAVGLYDGHWGFGQHIGWQLADVAIEKASRAGSHTASLRNCNHLARLGAFTEHIATAGHIAFLCVNGHGGALGVAPFGGREKRLSVNPFSYGIPTGGDPIVVDISPTVVAAGKVIVKHLAGEPIPEGWIIDSEGKPTTDPSQLIGSPGGSLLPLGGHKGFALGLVIDILSGALSGDNCSTAGADRWGNAAYLQVIDVESFAPRDEYESRVQRLIDYVRSSARLSEDAEILIPGEPERRTKERRQNEGVPVPRQLMDELATLRAKYRTP